MATVVVSHFYNEELLLPYWLEHHTKMFDHGVLINYASTDNSVDIIKEMAPDWEIRNSVNDLFSAADCDQEVIRIEREFPGTWRMALNTTEFVMASDFKSYCENFDSRNRYWGFRAQGIIMVESEEQENTALNYEPLIKQRHYGYFYPNGPRSRVVHNSERVEYNYGRHATFSDEYFIHINNPDVEVYLLWYGYSPWPQVVERKLQIKHKIPKADIDMGLGLEHMKDRKELEQTLIDERVKSYDLTQRHPSYDAPMMAMIDNFARVYHASMKNMYGDLYGL